MTVSRLPAPPDPWDDEDDLPPPIPLPGRHSDPRTSAAWETVVPARWRGRVALGPWHVVAVVVAACLALGMATWATLRHQPHVVSATAPSVASSVRPLTTAAAAPSTVTVDVEGKVRRPGIVVLKAGARVVDAVHAAGGSFTRADLGGLNLATVLSDGQQVVVGAPAPGAPGGSAAVWVA